MITPSDIAANFANVITLDGGVIRGEDELPRATIYHYFAFATAASPHDLLLVSEDSSDDAFAAAVLAQARAAPVPDGGLVKMPLAENRYGLDALILAPSGYHGELKGRLDAARASLTLCVPVHASEFSGGETAEEFILLRREVVPTRRWDRDVHPKTALRFDNPRTGGGTSDDYVLAKFDLVAREIDNLVGVPDGFMEILNVRGEVIELVFAKGNDFHVIPGRDDSQATTLPREAARNGVWRFLTG